MSPPEPAQVDVSWDSFMRNMPDPSRRPTYLVTVRLCTFRSRERLTCSGRRHVILGAFNTHYSGARTAEGFNYGGKTDILIRHEGRNLFIAECQVWAGQKGLTDTVGQLFRYQAWRDTKLAITCSSASAT